MTALPPVPFNRATRAPDELELIDECLAVGKTSGDGPFSEEASRRLSELHDNAPVLLTPSCTAALELSALLLDLQPGDEVIVPSFTFSSTASAFALMGARVVFCDIDPATLNIDVDQARTLITEKTKALAVVHYGGVMSIPNGLSAELNERGVMLIEDNAHGLFNRHRFDGQPERPLGTYGSLSTLSFHVTKNLSCGEGGALVINDPALVDRAEILREKGTNRRLFFRGMVDKYSWIDTGSSYLLSDLNAALLVSQLRHADVIQQRRLAAWDRYARELAPWIETMGARVVGDGVAHPAHLFAMVMPDHELRTALLAHTAERGVQSTFHYVPLHNSVAGLACGTAPLDCPHTISVSDQLIRLPLFSDITTEEVDRVLEAVSSFGG